MTVLHFYKFLGIKSCSFSDSIFNFLMARSVYSLSVNGTTTHQLPFHFRIPSGGFRNCRKNDCNRSGMEIRAKCLESSRDINGNQNKNKSMILKHPGIQMDVRVITDWAHNGMLKHVWNSCVSKYRLTLLSNGIQWFQQEYKWNWLEKTPDILKPAGIQIKMQVITDCIIM